MLYNHSNTGVIFGGGIVVEDVVEVLDGLQQGNFQNLFISSTGGNFGTTMMSLRYLMPKEITIIGGEIVASAALGIFLCGRRRLALPESKFIFHEVWQSFEGRPLRETEIALKVEIAELTKQYDVAKYFAGLLGECRELNMQNALHVSRRTTMFLDRICDVMRGDGIVLTAQEARLYGLVHEIIPATCVKL
jgi:ATP-dependent protease ClpP protease subunit